MKIFLNRLWSQVKEDVTVDTTNKLLKLIICSLITASIFISFFVQAFSYVNAIIILASCVYLDIKDKKTTASLPILIYLFAFSAVLRIPSVGITIYAVLMALQACAMAIELLIKVVKQNFKLNIGVVAVAVALCLYIFILSCMGRFSLSSVLSLGTGIVLCISIMFLKDDINLKELGLMLVYGLIVSCFLGLFGKYYPCLNGFYDITYAYAYFRFSGLYPNTNGLTYFTLIVLSVLMVLYIRKDIKLIFYPIFVIMLSILFATISKTIFIVLGATLIVLVALLIISEKGLKNSWVKIVSLCLCGIVGIAINYKNFIAIKDRFSDSINNEIIQNEINSGLNNGDKKDFIISDLTTGRTDLWKMYLKDIFSSPETALFGTELGQNYSIGDYNGKLGSHNTFIEILYHTGVVGFGLLTALLIMIFMINKNKFDMSGLLPFVAVGLCLCIVDSYSYIVFIYFAFIFLSLIKRENGDDNIEEENLHVKLEV